MGYGSVLGEINPEESWTPPVNVSMICRPLVRHTFDAVHHTFDDRGDIYKADYEGFYCVDCEEFKDEKEMDADKNCPTHRKPCQHRKEVCTGDGLKVAEKCPGYHAEISCLHHDVKGPCIMLSLLHVSQGNYFFRLSRYQKEIEELLSREDFVQPAARRNEVRSQEEEEEGKD